MTVKEYREKYPNCKYCNHWMLGDEYGYACSATMKRMTKGTAKKCPCYVPAKWRFDIEASDKK